MGAEVTVSLAWATTIHKGLTLDTIVVNMIVQSSETGLHIVNFDANAELQTPNYSHCQLFLN